MVTGCATDTPSEPDDRTVLFSEGFEGDLSIWEGIHMVSMYERYVRMRITADAAHNGKNSLTSDSSMTALYFKHDDGVWNGIAGLEFYMKAASPGQINFGVEVAMYPGSSGRVWPSFGIYFDPTDSIKCTMFAAWPPVDRQTMIAPVQANHWYTCKVEVDLENSSAFYYIDGKLVHTEQFTYEIGLMCIDVVLAFRGMFGKDDATSSEGAKSYYVDDISFYHRPVEK